jgi:hypothetical protein
VCPGHFWLLKFGKVPGSNICVEKEFKLDTRQYEEYKGVRFGDGDCVLLVDVWLHRSSTRQSCTLPVSTSEK